MKLNHDCIRDIMLVIETELNVDAAVPLTTLHKYDTLEKYDYSEILYCSIRLREAGFIETVGTDLIGTVGRIPKIRGLTYEGHLFLDNIRSNSRWNKVKEKASSVGMVALNIIANLAESYAKKEIGLD